MSIGRRLATVTYAAARVPLWILSGGPCDEDHRYPLKVCSSTSRSA